MFRKQIKEALKKQGLSIRKMCLEIEIREASVSEFLSGTRENIGIEKLEKIYTYLELWKTAH